MGFFTGHSIITPKTKVQEGCELRDFLTLFYGGEFKRETVIKGLKKRCVPTSVCYARIFTISLYPF